MNIHQPPIYLYIRVLPDGFLLKTIVFTICEHTVKTITFKRNSSGRTRIHEHTPPPPPIIGPATALFGTEKITVLRHIGTLTIHNGN